MAGDLRRRRSREDLVVLLKYSRRMAYRILLLAGLSLPLVTQCHAEGASFYDDFHTLSKRWQISDGWTNGGFTSCAWSKQNAVLTPNHISLLVTNVQAAKKPYSCGEIQSRDTYGYGIYEVRMKAVANPGLVSAFFTYTGPPLGTPQDEIDFEFVGKRHDAVNVAYHAKGNGGRSLPVPLGFNATTEFHTYAFIWTPDRIAWFVDNRLLHEISSSDDSVFPTLPGKIIFSIWTGSEALNSWLDAFSYGDKPLAAEYEFISYTKLGDKCQFPASLACRFGPLPKGSN